MVPISSSTRALGGDHRGFPNTRGGGARMLMLSLKASLASAAVVVTAAAMLLHAGPPIQRLLAAEVPRAVASLVVWLTPPYLYFVLNAVILCIAVSFRLDKPHADSAELAPSPTTEVVAHLIEDLPPTEYEEELREDASSTRFVTATTEDDRGDQEAVVLGQKETVSKAQTVGEEQEVGQEFVTWSSNFSPEQRPSTESLAGLEKPLVSIRFGHRKSLNPGPDGKALRRVARPTREETLESTWRTLTEGRAMPLARHLKKSDTWDTRATVREDAAEADAAAAAIRKSETFSDRATSRPLAGGGVGESSSSLTSKTSGVGRGRLRREPSLGQEELNRRVEAFINKFNEDMRLQRQQSLQQFTEMINQGSH